uniref:cytochrome c oxidase subunit II n=1 Tax=Flavobacterium sp. TaxID=239 RepID=UPI0037C19CE2
NNKLEAIWTIIPVIVLAGLIMYGLYTWNDIMFVDKEDEQDAIVIELYAKQFGWEARYAGDDKTLGKANVRLIEGINTLGVDLADPAAQDDKVVTELHIPKGKRVIFKMRSQDVLHSAYMPHFRAQMNCVPGMITQFSFIPTVTTADMRNDEAIVAKVDKINKIRTKNSKKIVAEGGVALDPYTFDYLLLCNKICGASHYNMQMKIVVDTPADFKAWLAEKPTLAQQWKEANAPAPAVAPAEATAVAVDSTKVVAQVIK